MSNSSFHLHNIGLQKWIPLNKYVHFSISRLGGANVRKIIIFWHLKKVYTYIQGNRVVKNNALLQKKNVWHTQLMSMIVYYVFLLLNRILTSVLLHHI